MHAVHLPILNLGEFKANSTFFCERSVLRVISEDICVEGHISSC